MRTVPLLLCLGLCGCVGYRTHYALESHMHAEAMRELPPGKTAKTVRYTVNITRTVAGLPPNSVSGQSPEIDALARRAIEDMRIFDKKSIRPNPDQADYHFVFDVRIDDTARPGALSAVIFPSHRARETTVRLAVLNARGEAFSHYTASAAIREARHILLLPFAPFWSPDRAESRARRSVFEAIAVRLIEDSKEFL